MRLVVGFFGGVVVGAISALLFAPIPGQELRAQVATKAGIQWDVAQTQVQALAQKE